MKRDWRADLRDLVEDADQEREPAGSPTGSQFAGGGGSAKTQALRAKLAASKAKTEAARTKLAETRAHVEQLKGEHAAIIEKHAAALAVNAEHEARIGELKGKIASVNEHTRRIERALTRGEH